MDWPARSPDLNPLDFCSWGYLKSKVYWPRPATHDELENNIRREVQELDPQMMSSAILDMRNRARLCAAKNGGHFEKESYFSLGEFMEFRQNYANMWPVIIFVVFGYCVPSMIKFINQFGFINLRLPP